MFRVCLCHTVLNVPFSLVGTCWERADLFAVLCVTFFLSLFHMVSWVRCYTWLYRFLIFAFLTYIRQHISQIKMHFYEFHKAHNLCLAHFSFLWKFMQTYSIIYNEYETLLMWPFCLSRSGSKGYQQRAVADPEGIRVPSNPPFRQNYFIFMEIFQINQENEHWKLSPVVKSHC